MPSYKTVVNGEPTTVTLKGPRLFVHPSCKYTIEQLPRMQHDERQPEDVLKVNATESDPWGGDDAYDMLRYGIMSRPPVSFKPKEHPAYASMAWFQSRWDRGEKKRQRGKLKRRG
jgi:hypothetical protein